MRAANAAAASRRSAVRGRYSTAGVDGPEPRRHGGAPARPGAHVAGGALRSGRRRRRCLASPTCKIVLSDRVAVVTGGASGIGRATVLRFLEAGAQVIVGDLNAENGQQLVDEVGEPDRLRFLAHRRRRRGRAVEALIAAAVARLRRPRRGVQQRRRRRRLRAADRDQRRATATARSPCSPAACSSGIKHAARVMIEQGRGRQHHQHGVDRRSRRWRPGRRRTRRPRRPSST